MHGRSLAFIGSLLLLPAALVIHALPAGGSSGQPAAFSTLDEQSCFTSGSGESFMKVCTSTDGNVVRFESPAGSEHIAVGTILEGYQLCDNLFSGSPVLHGYDLGFTESGFKASKITQPGGPNTFPLTIVQTTSDGDYRLTQKFSRDATEHDFTVTMTLKNLGSTTTVDIDLARFMDGDLDGDPSDDIYDHSANSVWGRDVHALSLTGLTPGLRGVTVESFSGRSANPGLCGVADLPVPTSPGDYVGNVSYIFDSMAPGARETVKLVFREF